MGNGSGVSRGDRNRNARLGRLRALVPPTNALVGIDLADAKQMVVDDRDPGGEQHGAAPIRDASMASGRDLGAA